MDSLNFKEIPYELIVGEIEGTLSEEETCRLHDWVNTSVKNKLEYENTVRLIGSVDLLAEYRNVSVEDAWKKLDFDKVDKTDDANIVQMKNRGRYIRTIVSIAAVCLVGIMLYLFYFKHDKAIILQTTGQGSLVQTLPDGTTITLGEHTEILFSEHNFLKDRTIEIKKGRVFVDIAPLKGESPFKISAENLLITDIGTSFSLSVDPELIKVNVETGIVSMAEQGDKSVQDLILKANEIGVYDKKHNVFKKDSVDQLNFVRWHDKKVRFTDAKLGQVAEALKDVYHMEIVFSEEALKDRRWGGYFENSSIDDILVSIAHTLDLQVTKGKSGYVISNK